MATESHTTQSVEEGVPTRERRNELGRCPREALHLMPESFGAPRFRQGDVGPSADLSYGQPVRVLSTLEKAPPSVTLDTVGPYAQ